MIHKAEVIHHHHHWVIKANGAFYPLMGQVTRCPDGSEVILPVKARDAQAQARRDYYRVSRAQAL